MGNSHSTSSTAGRRRSLLREEFMFPELDLESDWECEVYCLDVELQPLPPHAHDAHHVCVDEYTQEILPWEGRCVCSWHDSAYEIVARRPQSDGDKDAECACLQDETGEEFCVQCAVHPEEACSLDSGGTEADDVCVAELMNMLLDEPMASLAMNDSEGRCVENYGSLDSPYSEDGAEANILRHDGTQEHVPRSERKTQQSDELNDSPGDTQSRKASCSAKVSEKESSAYTERKRGAVSSHVFTDRRYSTTVLETRPTTMTPERSTVRDQTHTPKSGCVVQHPRRKSCSIPVLQSQAAAMLLDSKKRKFRLKDDPGWIPNPLDSDGDGSDFEDSGIFSDGTGSPAMSSSPLTYASFTPRAAAAAAEAATTQTRNLQTQRKRYNSEPMPGKSAASFYSPVHTVLSSPPPSSSTSKRRSGWGILRLTRKRKTIEKADDPVAQAEDSPRNDDDGGEEDDLTEQLRWLTMSDSELSQVAEQEDINTRDTAEDFNAVDTGEDFSNTLDTSPHVLTGFPAGQAGEARDPLSVEEEAASRRVNRFDDGELELDWLCEPEWNNLELEMFWSLLRPHLEHLLQPEDSELLPEACRAVGQMDAADSKLLDRCLLHVQWHIWKGSYRQAVADFRAIGRHFLCCAQSQLIESGTRDDVENLRLLFQRKRPSRFRLWI